MAVKRGLRIAVLAASFAVSASIAFAQPSQLRVKPTVDGYEIAGKGFGKDKAKVQVFEGLTQVPATQIISVADDLIVVRSKPAGMVQHRVVVGNQSGTASFMHAAALDNPKSSIAAGLAADKRPALSMGPSGPAGTLLRAPAGQAVLPSLTQTINTPTASMTGNRGQVPAGPVPLPSITQTVTTPMASMTGNRGEAVAAAPPPFPSLTQTLTTPPASMTGNR